MKLLMSLSVTAFTLDKEDLRFIKRDPKNFADSLYLSDLIALLRTANDAYHNKGTSQLTDAQYDILMAELAGRKPNHPLLRKAGATPTGRNKVKLPYPLFSLDKIKPGEASFQKWRSMNKGPYVVSDKEDGLSLEVIYEKGVPQSVYTRGNGTVGQNVTPLIPYLKIPQTIAFKKRFVVRMEAVMADATFDKYFSKESTEGGKKYENPRNLVAGIVNTTTRKHAALDHIHTIAYEIIEPRLAPSKALETLTKYRFHVVPYRVFNDITENTLTKYFMMRKAKSPVGLDGLVVEQDSVHARPPMGNPSYAVAFKVTSEEDEVEAKVLGVKWQVSKFGMLKPVVLIEPVRLAGVTVKKASGFNAQFIETGLRAGQAKSVKSKSPIGPGAVVRITRSGEVIPHIIEVVKPARAPAMPLEQYEYTKTGVDIQLLEHTSEVKVKRLTSFFIDLGIENIKQGTVQKLMDAGFDSILKIIRATPSDFMSIEGIQQRMAQKLYDSIRSVLSKPIKLSILMKGSGFFGLGMGERRIDMILKVHPNILDIYQSKGDEYTLNLIKQIPGFQETTARVFVDGIPGFTKWLTRSKLKTTTTESRVKQTGSSLKGQAIGFTGFRSAGLEQQIKQNGGTLTNGVTKDTTILLVASKTTTSSKAEKARKQGTVIMTPDEFTKRYKL